MDHTMKDLWGSYFIAQETVRCHMTPNNILSVALLNSFKMHVSAWTRPTFLTRKNKFAKLSSQNKHLVETSPRRCPESKCLLFVTLINTYG